MVHPPLDSLLGLGRPTARHKLKENSREVSGLTDLHPPNCPGDNDLVDYASDPPATFVQIQGPGAAWSPVLWRAAPSRVLDPRTAAVLSAVLLAAAEQVNADKLNIFKVDSPLDLELLALAMAYRDDDTGLMGDVFEWSVLLGVNGADEQIAQMVTDALQLAGVKVEKPQAVLVAAEKGRLVGYSPTYRLARPWLQAVEAVRLSSPTFSATRTRRRGRRTFSSARTTGGLLHH
jgi:hypothetical protein